MRIITRTVFILSLVSLFADVASELLYPVVPVYLKEIGFSVLWIGILEGIASFTAGISKGYFGKMSDEKGLRLPFIRLGYLLSAISKPMMAMLTAKWWIFLARTTDRLGKGIRTSARDAMLSAESTPQTKARVFGFHRGMDTAGAMIGPLIALLYLFWFPGDFVTLFYLAAIPGLISVLLIFFLKEKKNPSSTLGKGNFFSFFKYYNIAGAEYKHLIKGLLVFALFNSSDVFLLIQTRELIGDEVFNIWGRPLNADVITIAAYVFYNLVYALAAYPSGILADKLGFRKIFLTGIFLFTVVYAGFAFRPGIGMIFGLFFIYGIYAAMTEGVVKAWITNLSHDKNTATAIGFYTSCESVAALLSSIIAGLIWTTAGSFYTFLLTAIVAFGVAVYFMIQRSHGNPETKKASR